MLLLLKIHPVLVGYISDARSCSKLVDNAIH